MNLTALSRWGTFPAAVVVIIVSWATTADAQKFDEQFSHWPVELKINGRILIDNDVRDWGDSQPVLDRVAKNNHVVCFRRESAPPMNPLGDALKAAVQDLKSPCGVGGVTLNPPRFESYGSLSAHDYRASVPLDLAED